MKGLAGCPITVIPGSVLPEIGSKTAQLPDYNLKYSDDCKSIGECSKLCEKAAVRSVFYVKICWKNMNRLAYLVGPQIN